MDPMVFVSFIGISSAGGTRDAISLDNDDLENRVEDFIEANPENHATMLITKDEAVGFATHVHIRCSPPSCIKPCGHRVIWRTSELYAKLPNCRTYRQFTQKLVCSRCRVKGWLVIEPAGR